MSARILIAEDAPENVLLLEAYLHNLGFTLDIASNGVEAVEKRRRNSYDLILMDLRMPVMDGYTATHQIRAWEHEHQIARVPILALTADRDGCHETCRAGCDGYLTKPIERGDLLAAIARHVIQEASAADPIPDRVASKRLDFVANRRRDLETMRAALAAADFASIRSIGHNCKGIGAGYGFPEFSLLGAQLEAAALRLNTEVLACTLDRFEQALAEA